MKLIKNGTVVDPDWFFSDLEPVTNQGVNQIIPVEAFLKNPALSDGIWIDVDTNLEDIAPYFAQISLIVIEFSAYADGRGFSIAHHLRHFFGYTGEIWGSGSLVADQYALAIQCGIDAVLIQEQLLDRQPIEHWQEVLASAPTPYRFQDDMAKHSAVSSSTSNIAVKGETVTNLNARFESKSTEDLLAFVLNDQKLGKPAVVSSFGAESVVLLHLIAKVSPQSPILFLNTGKLFPETITYQKELVEQLQLTNAETLRPDATAINQTDPLGTLWQDDNAACCNLRKVNPLQMALADYDTWISGRKSYQSELRTPLKLFEISGNHIKVNPLANWSRDQVAEYMLRHDLSPHPLVDQGYPSVGCAPCTTPVCDGENARAGRWRGQNKSECGIHFVDGQAVREPQQSI